MKVYFINKKIILMLIFFTFILLSFGIYFSIFKTSNTISDIQNDSNNLYKKLIELYPNEKIAFLTFDDGPNISVTPKILDILKEENVKASFFVIGKCVDSHPEITKRAYDEGHYIANHGYSHNNNLLYKSSDNFLNEVKKTDLAIGNAIGVPNYCSHIFRFPNGFMSPSNKAKKKESVKLLQNIEETTVRDLVPADRRRLRFGNDIANGGVHFLHRIRKRAGNEDIFKGRHAVFIGHGILVYGNAGE